MKNLIKIIFKCAKKFLKNSDVFKSCDEKNKILSKLWWNKIVRNKDEVFYSLEAWGEIMSILQYIQNEREILSILKNWTDML